MMNLDQQIKALIKDAPNDPEMRQITETFVPVLRHLAGKFRYPEYYVLQTSDHAWVSFTLNHRTQCHVEKTVIYAFPDPNHAATILTGTDLSALSPIPIGLIDLLFQFYALNLAMELVVFDTAENTESPIVIARGEFEGLLQQLTDPMPGNWA
jgi:hypothetical protein